MFPGHGETSVVARPCPLGSFRSPKPVLLHRRLACGPAPLLLVPLQGVCRARGTTGSDRAQPETTESPGSGPGMRKRAGGRSALHLVAKVGVAGSNPVVRSTEVQVGAPRRCPFCVVDTGRATSGAGAAPRRTGKAGGAVGAHQGCARRPGRRQAGCGLGTSDGDEVASVGARRELHVRVMPAPLEEVELLELGLHEHLADQG